MPRTLTTGILVLALGTHGTAFAAEDQAEIDALKQKVTQLEAQVMTLSNRSAACEARLAELGAVEKEALAAYHEVWNFVEQGRFEQARSQLQTVLTKYGSTKAGKMAGNVAPEIAVLGKDAPKDWGIDKWFQGESQADLSGKKTTLVVFWETWCPHCRREVPKLQAMYTLNKDKGLQIVGFTRVNKTSTDELVSSFLEDNKVEYPVAKENGALSAYFNVGNIPAAAVIKDGKVVWRGNPALLTGDMLKRWL